VFLQMAILKCQPNPLVSSSQLTCRWQQQALMLTKSLLSLSPQPPPPIQTRVKTCLDQGTKSSKLPQVAHSLGRHWPVKTRPLQRTRPMACQSSMQLQAGPSAESRSNQRQRRRVSRQLLFSERHQANRQRDLCSATPQAQVASLAAPLSQLKAHYLVTRPPLSAAAACLALALQLEARFSAHLPPVADFSNKRILAPPFFRSRLNLLLRLRKKVMTMVKSKRVRNHLLSMLKKLSLKAMVP